MLLNFHQSLMAILNGSWSELAVLIVIIALCVVLSPVMRPLLRWYTYVGLFMMTPWWYHFSISPAKYYTYDEYLGQYHLDMISIKICYIVLGLYIFWHPLRGIYKNLTQLRYPDSI